LVREPSANRGVRGQASRADFDIRWSAAAWSAEHKYLDALAKTPQTESVRAIRLSLIAADKRIDDALYDRLGSFGSVMPPSMQRALDDAFNARATANRSYDLFLLANGVVARDFTGPCTGP
jgi:hypothetical protein